MRDDFHVQRGISDDWIVHNQSGAPLIAFRRRSVAEAYGKALAHRAKVSLVVDHSCGGGSMRYSERELTYAVCL